MKYVSNPEFGDGVYLFLHGPILCTIQVTQRSVANPGHELLRLRLSTHCQGELVNHGKSNMNSFDSFITGNRTVWLDNPHGDLKIVILCAHGEINITLKEPNLSIFQSFNIMSLVT